MNNIMNSRHTRRPQYILSPLAHMHLVRRLARACKCVSSLSGRLPLAENEKKLSLSERHLRSLDKNKDGVVSPKELYQRLKLNYKRCAQAVAYIYIRSPRNLERRA